MGGLQVRLGIAAEIRPYPESIDLRSFKGQRTDRTHMWSNESSFSHSKNPQEGRVLVLENKEADMARLASLFDVLEYTTSRIQKCRILNFCKE